MPRHSKAKKTKEIAVEAGERPDGPHEDGAPENGDGPDELKPPQRQDENAAAAALIQAQALGVAETSALAAEVRRTAIAMQPAMSSLSEFEAVAELVEYKMTPVGAAASPAVLISAKMTSDVAARKAIGVFNALVHVLENEDLEGITIEEIIPGGSRSVTADRRRRRTQTNVQH